MHLRPVPHDGALPTGSWRTQLSRSAAFAAVLALAVGAGAAGSHAEDSVDVQSHPAAPVQEKVLEVTELGLAAPAPTLAPVPGAAETIPPPTFQPLDLDKLMAPADPTELLAYLSQSYVAPQAELSLDEAIALALEHNHGLNQQRLTAAAAVQDVKVNWTALRPQVDVAGDVSWSYTNSHPQPTTINIPGQAPITFGGGGGGHKGPVETVALNLTQRIYDFGLTGDLIDLAEARHAIEHYTVSVAEQQLINDVAVAYLNYNLALGLGRIRQDELALATEVLRQARIQFDVGTVPRLDVIRAEARLQTAQGDLISAQAQVGDAAAVFFSLLGVEDKRYVPQLVTEDYLQLGDAPPAVDVAVAAALANRPELMVQSSTLLAGQEQRKLARNRPIINGFTNWQYSNPKAGSNGTYSSGLGVRIDWPVYTGGKEKVDRKKADLTIAAIGESIHDLEAQIELDTTSAWNALYAARQQAQVARKNLELSAETLRAAYVGYQAGVTPYLDFADAMDKNIAAALGYLFALANVRLANIDLQRAEGFPQGYPGDSRPEFDPTTPVETILGIPAPDATAKIS